MPRLPTAVSALLAIAFGIAPMGAFTAGLAADEARSPIPSILEEGVQNYRAGRYAAAAANFASALKAKPEDREAYDWYLINGDALLDQMRQQDVLRDVLDDLLRRARWHQAQLRRDPAYHDILIQKLRASEQERVVATAELVAVGPIAVPKLLARVGDNRQDEFRNVCRIVLTKMDHRAVLPLVEALNAKNQRLLMTTASILADIGDARALPRMRLMLDAKDLDSTLRRVLENSIAVIEQRSRVAASSVEELHFNAALRYFKDGDLVRDELVSSESLLWRWIEPAEGADDGMAIAKALTFVRCPSYAWNELMAEEILFDLISVRPSFAPAYSLLAADFAAQDIEPRNRRKAATEDPRSARSPDGTMAALDERIAALSGGGSGILDRARAMGADRLFGGFDMAVKSQRFDAVWALADMLSDRSLARPELNLPNATTSFSRERVGTPLVAGLDHGSKQVRYPSAMALARLDSSAPHLGSDKVVRLLADAVSEWGMRVVVVVDQDFKHRNTARAALQSKGFMVRTVEDGFALKQSLTEAPIKDAIIIPGDMLPTVRNASGETIRVPENYPLMLVEDLRNDVRTAKTPIFVSLPDSPELAAKVQTAFAGKVDGFIRKPFEAVALAGTIEAALAKMGEPPNVNRDEAEAVALAAAKALQVPDPMRTQFNLSVAAEALMKALENRADPLRIECCKALSNAARQPGSGNLAQHAIKLCDLYLTQEATLVPALRAVWVEAIGAIAAGVPQAQDIVGKALAHDDAGVRASAALAAARFQALAAGVIPADGGTLQAFLKSRRMDVRVPGAGVETR